MYEKFKMNENDGDAEIHFKDILNKSVEALFPVITDTIHEWVIYWKKWIIFKF